MVFPKVQTVDILDDSKFYRIVIKGLKDVDKYPAKASFEIRHIKKEEDLRSFRTESTVKIEDLIVGLTRVLAFVKAANGIFGDGFDEKIIKDPTKLQIRLNMEYEQIGKKIQQAVFDGVKLYNECK